MRRQLAEATYLYNDALKDSVDALDLESRAKQANISLTQAKVTAEQRNYESIAQALKFSGNYALAMYFEIEAKKKQIEIIKLTVAAKRIEADATIRAIELELSALKPGVELYEQKKLEIEVRLANAKAKLLEADAGKAQISALELEIRAMREAEDAIGNDTQARGQNTGAIRGQTGALREQIQVLGAFKDAQDLAARGKQGDSVLNPDGTRTSKNAGGQLSTTGGRLGYTISGEKNRLYDFINKGAPIATGDADFIRSNFKSASAELESSQKNATFYSFDGIKSALDEYNKARRALDALNEAEALASYVPPTTGALTVAPQGTQPVRQGDVPPRAGATQTVNINILGRSMQVNVVGQEDVNNLTSVFRQLETAAATAGRATR